MNEVFDIIIIGAGPVGLACGIEASQAGLSHLILEKESVLNSLVKWPVSTTFFSTPELLEIGDLPFVCNAAKPTRREGLIYYRKAAERYKLNIHLYEAVTGVKPMTGGFEVASSKETYQGKYVIVASGFFDHPNLLNIKGEELQKVSHYYKEPYPYSGTDVLIIGGKNSAVEAALDLTRNGARVTIAVRKPEFGHSVKYWVKPDIENRVKEGRIQAFFNTTVQEIKPDSVIMQTETKLHEIKNDFVLALTGYHPNYELLAQFGVEVTPEKHFMYDPETMETTRVGLYLAGVAAAGIDIGKLFIENGRIHAKQIVNHILTSGDKNISVKIPKARAFQDGD